MNYYFKGFILDITENNYMDWRTPCGARVASYDGRGVTFDRDVYVPAPEGAEYGWTPVYKEGSYLSVDEYGKHTVSDFQLVYDPLPTIPAFCDDDDWDAVTEDVDDDDDDTDFDVYHVLSPDGYAPKDAVFKDFDEALDESERLSGLNPGKMFGVAKLLTVTETQPVTLTSYR